MLESGGGWVFSNCIFVCTGKMRVPCLRKDLVAGCTECSWFMTKNKCSRSIGVREHSLCFSKMLAMALFLVQCHIYGYGYGNCCADHRVVAHAEEAHHLNVCRHR